MSIQQLKKKPLSDLSWDSSDFGRYRAMRSHISVGKSEAFAIEVG
jgi:hypothetical protein